MNYKTSGNKFIIAVGSSAGGLEPMKSFFNSTPHDHATYIILRHIPMNYKSELQLILSQHSKLEFIEAENNMEIIKDKVYMPPPSMYMTIKNERLYLQPRIQRTMYPNWTIDIFLESLARNNGKFSIAVILSGGGSDGTKGICRVKDAGGMVIAQRPDSCIQNSMPLSAIGSGHVDQVLLPSAMPAVISEHVDNALKKKNQMARMKGAGDDLLHAL